MKRIVLICLLLTTCLFATESLQAQKLGDLKRKAQEKLKKALEDKTTVKSTPDTPTESDSGSGNSDKTLNKRLSTSELLATMDDASTAFNNKNYSESRYSINAAMIEIEQRLGEKVLDQMPREVMGQSYDPARDKAISTGVGFIGLEIIRSYPSNSGDIQAIIANNSLLIGPYSMALSNPQYISQNENMKSVSVDGKRGVLELDDNTYKLAIPFGQSSVFLLECESCNNESDVLGLAKKFDLDNYLSILGEAPIQINEN